MPEFRWILLGLGLLLLAGIWWSGRRAASQARGSSSLRDAEAAASREATGARLSMPEPELPEPTLPVTFSGAAPREPAISPYEPLRIRSGAGVAGDRAMSIPVLEHPHEDSGVVQLDDVDLLRNEQADHFRAEPLHADPPRHDPVEISLEGEPAEIAPDLADTTDMIMPAPAPAPAAPPVPAFAPEPAPAPIPATATGPAPAPAITASARPVETAAPATPESHLRSGRFGRARETRPAPRTDTSGRFARVKPEGPKPIELQKIITLRVLCMTEGGWPGEDVAAALVGSDLVHGRFGVFHRLHADGRSVLYVASLVEPGSFDPALMPEQRFPGLSIFAVLPGPLEPVATMDLLYGTARQLATDLAGMMQDEQGNPLSPQRAGQLREEVVIFQHQLQAASAP